MRVPRAKALGLAGAAMGVAEPMGREGARAGAWEAVRHALYGVGTVAVYESALRLVGWERVDEAGADAAG